MQGTEAEKGEARAQSWISRASGPHLQDIQYLDEVCGLKVWPLQTYRDLLQRLDVDFLVALGRSAPRATGFCLGRRTAPDLEILKIGVDPARWGQGIGQALLGRSLQLGREAGCQHCFLEVRVSNRRAIDFYLRAGFLRAGLRKDYYSAPLESALVMRRVL